LENVEEIAGHGLKATINGKELLVGNFKLLDKENIQYDIDPSTIVYTLIAIAYDRKFAGYLTIADSIKADAQTTIDKLKTLGVNTTMLSGDKSTVVNDVASKLGIQSAFGDLLPEDKVNKVKEIKAKNETVAFVGDGVNDAPVVALSDVGIAMGGLGSDATIETADVVIQDDMPSKIPMAINIGKQTRKIVWQNITLAFVVKAVVLVLGAGGLATMWEAVFADVGVALLAILNAVRIQKMKF
ncbi:MAG: HAD-IC family P-type ATPase, partial [Bacteroidetes bacterium]|nr:HAD-IC family P-type ATPase [Bacteroidota bacterium]